MTPVLLLQVLAGAVAALVLLAIVRRRGAVFELRFWAVGLAVAALIYFGFALAAGGEGAWREVLGVAVFAAVAAAGWRGQARLLALGWAAHVAWDLGLHLLAPSAYAPAWYAAACVGLDLTVAAYLAAWARARVGPAPAP